MFGIVIIVIFVRVIFYLEIIENTKRECLSSTVAQQYNNPSNSFGFAIRRGNVID